MKSAIFYGVKDLQVKETQIREPRHNEVTIRVKSCGVCGTDLHIFSGAEGAATCTPPTILGHEFSGIISEVGSDITEFHPGDRVCVDPSYHSRTGFENLSRKSPQGGLVGGGIQIYIQGVNPS